MQHGNNCMITVFRALALPLPLPRVLEPPLPTGLGWGCGRDGVDVPPHPYPEPRASDVLRMLSSGQLHCPGRSDATSAPSGSPSLGHLRGDASVAPPGPPPLAPPPEGRGTMSSRPYQGYLLVAHPALTRDDMHFINIPNKIHDHRWRTVASRLRPGSLGEQWDWVGGDKGGSVERSYRKRGYFECFLHSTLNIFLLTAVRI